VGGNVAMSRNDFLVALFGRPVWFQCTKCRRVIAAETQDVSPDTWLEEAVAMEAWQVSPAEVWWFQTVCHPCQNQRRS